MKLTSLTFSRLVVTTMCAIAVTAVLSGPTARADMSDKRTVLTVDQPIQVTDKLLDPGTYVFVLVGGHSDRYTDRDTVEIFNGDQTRVIDTVVAIPTYRVEPTGKSQFSFWETPPGTARALRDWYYPGDNYGREFSYPKHPAMLTAELHTWSPPPTAEPAPMPAPAAAVSAPTAEQPVQVADAAPAPAPEPAPEPQSAAEPAPAAQEPATLPKTASPYPAIGLGGFLLVGLYGLLRLKQAMYLK
ncbi:MAG: hypothetical protein ABSH42_13230 [Bryobacteraceae bacterium]